MTSAHSARSTVESQFSSTDRPRFTAGRAFHHPGTPIPALRDVDAAYAWLDTERPTLVAVATHTATSDALSTAALCAPVTMGQCPPLFARPGYTAPTTSIAVGSCSTAFRSGISPSCLS